MNDAMIKSVRIRTHARAWQKPHYGGMNMRNPTSITGQTIRRGAMVTAAALALLVPAASAQTPEGEMATGVAHPAHIHVGSCPTPGDVVAPLTDVKAPEGERSGQESAIPVLESYTVVDVPLQDIIDGGHAINVHESKDAMDVYIACGDIGGVVSTADDDNEQELVVALTEQSDSGLYGVAWLGAKGDQTEVNVTLFEAAP